MEIDEIENDVTKKDVEKKRAEVREAFGDYKNLRSKIDDLDEASRNQHKKMDRMLDKAQTLNKEAEVLEKQFKMQKELTEPDEETRFRLKNADSTEEKIWTPGDDGGSVDFDAKAYSLLEEDERKGILKNLDQKKHAQNIKEATFRAYLHSKGEMSMMTDIERKTLNSLRGDEGGYVVDQQFMTEVIRTLENIVHIRDRARTFQVGAQTAHFPTIQSSIETNWVTELVSSVSETTDEPFGKTTFDAKAMKLLMKVSEELWSDSFINLEQELQRVAADDFAKQEEIAFLKGTGDNQPLGLFEASLPNPGLSGSADHEILFGDFNRFWIVDLMQMESRVLEERFADNWKIGLRFWKRTDASPVEKEAFRLGQTDDSNLDSKSIMDIIYDLPAVYRQNGTFLTHRNTIKAVRKLQDDQSRFIWQPGLQAGEPATLAGFEVLESEYSPDPNA